MSNEKRTHVGAALIQWYEKRRNNDGTVDVIGWYKVATGVLKNQMSRAFCATFEDEDSAEAVYGEMNWYSPYTSPSTTVEHLPGEGDFVPGGEYPDDI